MSASGKKILVVKMSSMGDIIHTFPAITEALQHQPDIQFDWVVEESFKALPSLHPGVCHVFPIALRRWRKNILSPKTYTEINTFLKQLRQSEYDFVIDAQGLIKSALVSLFAKGPVYGLSRSSAREPLAALTYQRHFAIPSNQHAIHKTQALFATCLGYTAERDGTMLNYGIKAAQQTTMLPQAPFIVFLHGTTWKTKEWPVEYWRDLLAICNQNDYRVVIPWANAEEQARAHQIAHNKTNATILPKMELISLSSVINQSTAVVAVDTGLSHLAAALDKPVVSVYGPTNPKLTGTKGKNQLHLNSQFPCAPCLQETCRFEGSSQIFPACFGEITPLSVWQSLTTLLD